jgi:hypothetical protein
VAIQSRANGLLFIHCGLLSNQKAAPYS